MNDLDSLDHLVWAVPDFPRGVEQMAKMLAVEPSPGGVYSNLGTQNALVGLGGHRYLGILGPLGDGPAHGFGARLASLPFPRLWAWAIAVTDIVAAERLARSLGLYVEPSAVVSRLGTDGQIVTSRHLYLGDGPGGQLPFLIEWGETPHPSTSLEHRARLTRFEVGGPVVQPLRRVAEAFGLQVSLVRAATPYLSATLEGPSGTVVLR